MHRVARQKLCGWLLVAASVMGRSGAALADGGPVALRLCDITIKRDPVAFQHERHLKYVGVEGCATCHHHATGRSPARCASCHPGRHQTMEAFHGLCKGCHRRVAESGVSGAPGNCKDGGCHGALELTIAGSQRASVRYEHQRHRMARGGLDCRRCHHADPAGTPPKPCAACHARRNDERAAFHKLCIGCHVEASGGKPGAPTTRCGFCHIPP